MTRLLLSLLFLLALLASPLNARHLLKLRSPNILARASESFEPVILPCDDVQVVDKTTLNFDFPNTTAPWNLPSAQAYRSERFSEIFFNNILLGHVPGLESEMTFQFVFHAFQTDGCMLYPHGGSVRDILLGLHPVDIDVEYSCTAKQLKESCIRNFGASLCHVTKSYFYIGPRAGEEGLPDDNEFEQLEGVNWQDSLYAPKFAKEYTANTLSYDVNGNGVIIDVTGTGVLDTCNRHIRIPTSDWAAWRNDSYLKKNNGLQKIPRYWKLRAPRKNFSPLDDATQQFIVNSTRDLWDATPPMRNIFASFFCKAAGGTYQNQNATCLFSCPIDPELQATVDRIALVLAQDIGQDWFDAHIASKGMNQLCGSLKPDVLSAASSLQPHLPSFLPALLAHVM